MIASNKFKILSWSLYDFATTIFAMNIVSLYLPLWVTIQKKAPDKFYIIPYYAALCLAALVLPILGIISDQLKRRIVFLRIFTIIPCLAIAFIGILDNLFAGILLFAVGIFFYQIATTVFYVAVLPQIAPEGKMGRVSGFGVSLGYLGTIVGLIAVKPFADKSGYGAIFLPTALLFLAFSLPCLLSIKDSKETNKFNLAVLKQSLNNLLKSAQAILKNKNLLSLFLAIFLALNGINSVILNMGVYAKRVMVFSDGQLHFLLIISSISAMISAFIFGFLCERFGSKRILSAVLAGWTLVLLFISGINDKNIFTFIGPLVGILLAGTWVSSRPFIIMLAPKGRLGEFIGFTALISISASLLGQPLWLGIITIFDTLGMARYRIAIASLAILILFGFLILQKVPEKRLSL